MITLPENDPSNEHWMSLYHSAVLLSKGLPKENGIAYAMNHFLELVDLIHRSDVVLKAREARPYFAATVLKGLKEVQGDSMYFQGIRHGYFLLHLGLRYHQESDLPSVLKMVTLAYTGSTHLNMLVYRDVLGYIKKDITGNRYATLDALRNDILIYFDKIHRASLETAKKQQTLLACCQVLHVFH